MVDDFRPQQPQRPEQPEQTTDKPEDFQGAYDNKPETYVTPAGEPTTLDTARNSSSLEMPKKKSSAGKWLLWGLVVLLIAGLGAFAYWQWSEADDAKKELLSTEAALQTAQDAAKKDKPVTEPDEPVTNTQTDTIQSRADDMVKAIKVAHLNTDYVSKLDKVKGDYVGIITGMPNKDGLEIIFKNTSNGLVQIATYDGMAGMSKTEAATLKSDYGFDAAAFGLTVNP